MSLFDRLYSLIDVTKCKLFIRTEFVKRADILLAMYEQMLFFHTRKQVLRALVCVRREEDGMDLVGMLLTMIYYGRDRGLLRHLVLPKTRIKRREKTPEETHFWNWIYGAERTIKRNMNLIANSK